MYHVTLLKKSCGWWDPRLWNFVTLVIAVPKQDDQDDEGQHDDEQERDDHRHHDQAGLLVFRGGAVKRTLGRKEEQQLANCHVLFWNALLMKTEM